MGLWRWIEAQGIPGMVISGWAALIPIGAGVRWVEHRIQRRHAERIAATDRLTAALTRPKED